MLSGHDMQVVGLYKEAEVICLDCAAKRTGLGSVRANRIAMGLSSQPGDWSPYRQWEAEDDALDNNGYDCPGKPDCPDRPDGERCERCTEKLCADCGKRLDA